MATVYLATDLKHHREVAVKVLRPELAPAIGVDRFLREVRITAQLQHPRIITLIDSGEAAGIPYYIIPYVAGESLGAKLTRERQLPVSEALSIATDVGAALGYAHRRDIIHRDVKPGNILISQGGPIVTDFGIAIALRMAGGSRLTESGLSLGTPEYMSPEQALGDPGVDARSDIYSLGCVLYEMLAGSPPYAGATAQAVLAQIVNAPVPSVRTIRSAVPAHVDRALQRALAKIPSDRFPTVQAFCEALNEPPATTGPTPHHVTPRRRLALAAGVVVIAVVTALALRVARPSRARFGGIGPNGRVSLVLSTDSLLFHPALSPDGKLIAYGMGEAGGPRDLYVRQVAGGRVIRLTHDSSPESTPSFSPDGQFIAFTRDESIWIIPTLGGDPAHVVRRAERPVWSPDGQRLGFVRSTTGAPDVLATVGRDGTNEREVFRSPSYFLRGLAWSPDGSEFAVERSLGGVTGEIWRVSLDGRSTALTRDPPGVDDRFPAYTPDGLGVVHSSTRGGATNIWVIPRDGGAPIQLTSGSGPDTWITVARDGTIGYLNARWQMELSVYDLQRGTHRSLRRQASLLGFPAFSPDGGAVAFSQLEQDGAWHIWLVSLAEGQARQLTKGSPPQVYPRFTPDGQFVIYQSWSDSSRIWRVPLVGGPPVALTAPGENGALADVSPDGTRMAYVRMDHGEHIYVRPLEGGEPRLLTESPGTAPRWSPDGQLIAFSRDRGFGGGIFVIAPDGTGERRLTDRGGWPRWWPDGTRLAFQMLGPDDSPQIGVVTLGGGPPRRLEQFQFLPRPVPFDIAPDGRRMAVVQGTHLTDELWVIHPAR